MVRTEPRSERRTASPGTREAAAISAPDLTAPGEEHDGSSVTRDAGRSVMTGE